MLKEIISLFTLSCFILSFIVRDTVSAAGSRPAVRLSADGTIIPHGAGRITGAWSPAVPARDLVVVNIQDLHCHPEVQRNIAKILQSLDEKYHLSHVYVEGGYGDIDTSWLCDIKDKRLKSEILDGLVNGGKLTGTEYYSVTSGRPGLLKGIENKEMHRQNIERLGKILEKKEYFEKTARKLERDLSFMEAKYFNSRNKKFNWTVERHRKGKIPTEKFYLLLSKYADKINADPDSFNGVFAIRMENYPNLTAYAELVSQGKRLHYKDISRQLQYCVGALKARLPYSTYSALLKQTGNLSRQEELCALLAQLDRQYRLNISGTYPALHAFLLYTEKNRGINPVAMIAEEKRLVEEIRIGLSMDISERDISFLADFFQYFKDYLLNTLSADDHEYFAQKFGKFRELWSTYAYVDRLEELAPDFPLLNEYYAVNCRRNDAFLENIPELKGIPAVNPPSSYSSYPAASELLKSAEIVAIVTGGFHTEGLKQLLKERNIPCIAITPDVTAGTSRSGPVYTELIKEQAKYAITALAPELLTQAMVVYQIKAILERYKDTEARKGLIRELETKTGIAIVLSDKGDSVAIHYGQDQNPVTIGLDEDQGAAVVSDAAFLTDALRAALSQLRAAYNLAEDFITADMTDLLSEAADFATEQQWLFGNGRLPGWGDEEWDAAQKKYPNIGEFPDALQAAILLSARKHSSADGAAERNQALRVLLAVELIGELIRELASDEISEPDVNAAILPGTRGSIKQWEAEGRSPLAIAIRIAVKEMGISLPHPAKFIQSHTNESGRQVAQIVVAASLSAAFACALSWILASGMLWPAMPLLTKASSAALIAAAGYIAGNLGSHTFVDWNFLVTTRSYSIAAARETLKNENIAVRSISDFKDGPWESIEEGSIVYVDYDDVIFKHRMPFHFRAMVALYQMYGNMDTGRLDNAFMRLLKHILRNTAARFVSEWYRYYENGVVASKEYEITDGFKELVDRCRDKKIPIVIVTNRNERIGNGNTLNAMERRGINTSGIKVIATGMSNGKKPSALLKDLAGREGIRHVYYIEDQLSNLKGLLKRKLPAGMSFSLFRFRTDETYVPDANLGIYRDDGATIEINRADYVNDPRFGKIVYAPHNKECVPQLLKLQMDAHPAIILDHQPDNSAAFGVNRNVVNEERSVDEYRAQRDPEYGKLEYYLFDHHYGGSVKGGEGFVSLTTTKLAVDHVNSLIETGNETELQRLRDGIIYADHNDADIVLAGFALRMLPEYKKKLSEGQYNDLCDLLIRTSHLNDHNIFPGNNRELWIPENFSYYLDSLCDSQTPYIDMLKSVGDFIDSYYRKNGLLDPACWKIIGERRRQESNAIEALLRADDKTVYFHGNTLVIDNPVEGTEITSRMVARFVQEEGFYRKFKWEKPACILNIVPKGKGLSQYKLMMPVSDGGTLMPVYNALNDAIPGGNFGGREDAGGSDKKGIPRRTDDRKDVKKIILEVLATQIEHSGDTGTGSIVPRSAGTSGGAFGEIIGRLRDLYSELRGLKSKAVFQPNDLIATLVHGITIASLAMLYAVLAYAATGYILPGLEPLPITALKIVGILVAAVNIPSVVHRIVVTVFTGIFYSPDSQGDQIELLEDDKLPPVLAVIAIRNEPAGLVIKNLESLLKSDYPKGKLTVVVYDNSDLVTNGELNSDVREICKFAKEHPDIIKFRGKYEDVSGTTFEIDDNVEGSELLKNAREVRGYRPPGGKSGACNEIFIEYFKLPEEKRPAWNLILDADSTSPVKSLKQLVSAGQNRRARGEKIGLIQGMLESNNEGTNWLTKARSMMYELLCSYYMPGKVSAGVVSNWGHGVLISTDALLETHAVLKTGGLPQEISEDLAFSIWLWLIKGDKYENLYVAVPMEESETETWAAFRVQQNRWSKGTTILIMKLWPKILFSKHFKWYQKIDITYDMFGYVLAFVNTASIMFFAAVFAGYCGMNPDLASSFVFSEMLVPVILMMVIGDNILMASYIVKNVYKRDCGNVKKALATWPLVIIFFTGITMQWFLGVSSAIIDTAMKKRVAFQVTPKESNIESLALLVRQNKFWIAMSIVSFFFFLGSRPELKLLYVIAPLSIGASPFLTTINERLKGILVPPDSPATVPDEAAMLPANAGRYYLRLASGWPKWLAVGEVAVREFGYQITNPNKFDEMHGAPNADRKKAIWNMFYGFWVPMITGLICSAGMFFVLGISPDIVAELAGTGVAIGSALSLLLHIDYDMKALSAGDDEIKAFFRKNKGLIELGLVFMGVKPAFLISLGAKKALKAQGVLDLIEKYRGEYGLSILEIDDNLIVYRKENIKAIIERDPVFYRNKDKQKEDGSWEPVEDTEIEKILIQRWKGSPRDIGELLGYGTARNLRSSEYALCLHLKASVLSSYFSCVAKLEEIDQLIDTYDRGVRRLLGQEQETYFTVSRHLRKNEGRQLKQWQKEWRAKRFSLFTASIDPSEITLVRETNIESINEKGYRWEYGELFIKESLDKETFMKALDARSHGNRELFIETLLFISDAFTDLISRVVKIVAPAKHELRKIPFQDIEKPAIAALIDNEEQLDQLPIDDDCPTVVIADRSLEPEDKSGLTNIGIKCYGKKAYAGLDEKGRLIIYADQEIIAQLNGYVGPNSRLLERLGAISGRQVNGVYGARDTRRMKRDLGDMDMPVVSGDMVAVSGRAIINEHNASVQAGKQEVSIVCSDPDKVRDTVRRQRINKPITFLFEEIRDKDASFFRDLQSQGSNVYVKYDGTDAEELRALKDKGVDGLLCLNLTENELVKAGIHAEELGNRNAWIASNDAENGRNALRITAENVNPGTKVKDHSVVYVESAVLVYLVKKKMISSMFPPNCILMVNGGEFREVSRLTTRDVTLIEMFGANVLEYLRGEPEGVEGKKAYERDVAYNLEIGAIQADMALHQQLTEANYEEVFGYDSAVKDAIRLHLSRIGDDAVRKEAFLNSLTERLHGRAALAKSANVAGGEYGFASKEDEKLYCELRAMVAQGLVVLTDKDAIDLNAYNGERAAQEIIVLKKKLDAARPDPKTVAGLLVLLEVYGEKNKQARLEPKRAEDARNYKRLLEAA